MTWLQAIILGMVQGLTEFIPVSSSGHLILLHQAMGIQQNGLAFDVALHFGTLLALIGYFWKDLIKLFLGLSQGGQPRRLAWLLIIATIPAVISGVLLETAAESTFRSARLVSINLMLIAVFMLLAESFAKRSRSKTDLEHVSVKQSLGMGFAQAAAVVPGVSRSGGTITAGLFLGMDRVAATRFSFLLGIPITAGAILKVMTEQSVVKLLSGELNLVIVGVVTSLISGIIAIRFLLKYLSKHSLAVFAYYRLGLGTIVLLILAFHH